MSVNIPLPDWIHQMILADPTDVWGKMVGMGLGNLIAALTGVKRFDKRGDILFFDNFEYGFNKCEIVTDGTGGAVSLQTAGGLYGGLAAKLIGGSDSYLYAALGYNLCTPPVSRIGAEFAFYVGTGVDLVELGIVYFDGARRHDGGIRADPTLPGKWEYYDSAGVWQSLLSARFSQASNLFHTCKLVIDPENDLYVRALVSGQEVDMSSYPLYAPSSTTVPRLTVAITVYSVSGLNGWIYVDNVVVTQNEPA